MTIATEPQDRDEAILERLRRGTPYRAISAEFGISLSALSAIAKRQAKLEAGTIAKLMRTKALDALDYWAEAMESGAKTGKHLAAKEWLTHARVLEPITSEQPQGAKVAIIIGQPGAPLTFGDAQVVDAQIVSGESDE